jgi:hypothetical protein
MRPNFQTISSLLQAPSPGTFYCCLPIAFLRTVWTMLVFGNGIVITRHGLLQVFDPRSSARYMSSRRNSFLGTRFQQIHNSVPKNEKKYPTDLVPQNMISANPQLRPPERVTTPFLRTTFRLPANPVRQNGPLGNPSSFQPCFLKRQLSCHQNLFLKTRLYKDYTPFSPNKNPRISMLKNKIPPGSRHCSFEQKSDCERNSFLRTADTESCSSARHFTKFIKV